MKPADIKIWERFMLAYPDKYDTVDYDVGLIQDKTAENTAADLVIAGDEQLYKYKVDVVGYNKDGIDIIELKDKATPAAIGQVSSYWVLYDKEIKPTEPTRAVIICGETSPDMDMLAKEHDILLLLV